MVEILVMFGLLASAATCLIVVLLRRGSSRTENADGLLLEQRARGDAQHNRAAFRSAAVHNSMIGWSHKS
ncbi:hypothetical protein ACF08M_36625 [Streptomyces sp. NPDC015032]|uniref:hypothetical protein n=1 Tax=Streptomyces sp. NPDC015032 TaxID=3364937 RepID=UPI0036FE9E57